jgi:dipeptidyl-peptidase-4
MKREMLIWTGLFISAIGFSQQGLQTVAERSNFESTSKYSDVMSFVNLLKASSSIIRVETIATTTEGKDLPLLIIADPMPKSPADLINDKRIVIYIQANIHAGEVEGKEASLMFARDLLKEKNPTVLKNIVFLICPIFNADGNDKISTFNRTDQNGPKNGVGVRYNGQFLDLNRDAMKIESPELEGVIKNVLNVWDPSVMMDCHTTDGSFHVEPTTFTWMVNPVIDNSLISYMRDKMMPSMSSTILNKYKVENCFYGEFVDMLSPEKGWLFESSEPRYLTNYIGLRNRLAILNENYIYADFKSRVNACYFLIKSLTDYVNQNKDEIKSLLNEKIVNRGLNPAVTDSFAIEYKVRPISSPVTIKTFEAELNTEKGQRGYKRTDRLKTVTVPYLIDYYPVKNVRLPFAYIVDTQDPVIKQLLLKHGVKVEKITDTRKIVVERFNITGLKGAPRLNQGHYNNSLSGNYVIDTLEFKKGTFVVRTSQPLANLAAYLLEPQSNDGLVTWNFLDRYLVPQWGQGYNNYPIYRVMSKTDLKTIAVEK